MKESKRSSPSPFPTFPSIASWTAHFPQPKLLNSLDRNYLLYFFIVCSHLHFLKKPQKNVSKRIFNITLKCLIRHIRKLILMALLLQRAGTVLMVQHLSPFWRSLKWFLKVFFKIKYVLRIFHKTLPCFFNVIL